METYEQLMEKYRKRNATSIKWGWFWVAWNAVFAIYNVVAYAIWGYPWSPVFAIIFVVLLAVQGYFQYKNYQRKWYTFGSARRRSTD